MLQFFRQRSLNKALEDYIYVLAPELASRYGTSGQYTLMQIKKTALALSLSQRHIAYAIAMFRQQSSEHCLGVFAIDQTRLDSLRQQIAQALFAGNTAYTALDVLRLTQGRGWRGGASPSWQANRLGRTSL